MDRSHAFLAVLASLFAGSLAPRGAAQQVLFEFNGSSSTNPTAQGVVVGDWNGDAVPDVAIGSPYDDTVAIDAGAVFVVSGADGSVLHTWYGANSQDYFGVPVALPDLDGDGLGEVAVNAVWSDVGGKDFGSMDVFAGRTGNLLWRVDGKYRFLGAASGAVRDLTGDGIPEVYVTEIGELYVFSGADGTLYHSVTGARGSLWGIASAAADVTGDGIEELLVGAPDAQGAGIKRGRATIYDGTDLSVVNTMLGSKDFEHLGTALGFVGDLDVDGLADYAVVSEHEDWLGMGNVGAIVRVFSSATHSQLTQFKTDPKRYYLFPRFDRVGDVNGDGAEDFGLLSSRSDGSWAPFLMSGATILPLYSFEHLETRGIVTGGGADFDGDGFRDLFVDDPYSGNGRFRVYSGDDLWLDVRPHDPSQNQTIQLATREGVPGRVTVLVIVGVDGVPAFQVVNGLGSFDATGGRALSATVPPGLSGHTIDLQSFADDATGRVVESAIETLAFR